MARSTKVDSTIRKAKILIILGLFMAFMGCVLVLEISLAQGLRNYGLTQDCLHQSSLAGCTNFSFGIALGAGIAISGVVMVMVGITWIVRYKAEQELKRRPRSTR